ncbi:hypothetical protein NQ317_009206 [Molorchus minor]|uniref:Uncharacterized protein n=1 Tax=Molorchus minor TaxID=1323400 RepID=A0ABQ9J4X3_9CUCU|nr:hypothetical protein NQ317_009206 [Molorchus minor]
MYISEDVFDDVGSYRQIIKSFILDTVGSYLEYLESSNLLKIEIKTLAIVPKVASFMNLANAEAYSGHCIRRFLTTLLANKGADLTTIKRHGEWKSSAAAES